jgi:hypothetical protein
MNKKPANDTTKAQRKMKRPAEDERLVRLENLLRATLPFLDESDDGGAVVLADEIREVS